MSLFRVCQCGVDTKKFRSRPMFMCYTAMLRCVLCVCNFRIEYTSRPFEREYTAITLG